MAGDQGASSKRKGKKRLTAIAQDEYGSDEDEIKNEDTKSSEKVQYFGTEVKPQFEDGKVEEQKMYSLDCIWDVDMSYELQVSSIEIYVR